MKLGLVIDLDICVTGGDPSKSADCANQMIQDDVAAVVLGVNQFTQNTRGSFAPASGRTVIV